MCGIIFAMWTDEWKIHKLAIICRKKSNLMKLIDANGAIYITACSFKIYIFFLHFYVYWLFAFYLLLKEAYLKDFVFLLAWKQHASSTSKKSLIGVQKKTILLKDILIKETHILGSYSFLSHFTNHILSISNLPKVLLLNKFLQRRYI